MKTWGNLRLRPQFLPDADVGRESKPSPRAFNFLRFPLSRFLRFFVSEFFTEMAHYSPTLVDAKSRVSDKTST